MSSKQEQRKKLTALFGLLAELCEELEAAYLLQIELPDTEFSYKTLSAGSLSRPSSAELSKAAAILCAAMDDDNPRRVSDSPPKLSPEDQQLFDELLELLPPDEDD